MQVLEKGATCSNQMTTLNEVLGACGAIDADVTCSFAKIDGQFVLSHGGDCTSVESAFAGMVAEYSRGTVNSRARCVIGGFLTESQQSCEAVARTINNAMQSFTDGTFEACEMTTPTSSPST